MHRLPKVETDRIADAIAGAEKKTSAEIKVVVLRYCWTDIRERAKSLFFQHELHKTKDRNAVMILLVLANREFLVFGDQGIHEKVQEDFWLTVRDSMQNLFRGGLMGDGICAGIEQVGQQLAEFFPRRADDVNEVSDEVIHED